MHLPTIYNVIGIKPNADCVSLKLQRDTDKQDVFYVEISTKEKGRKVRSTLDVNLPKFYYKYTARIINSKGYYAGCFDLSPLNDNQEINWSDTKDINITQLQYIYEFEEI